MRRPPLLEMTLRSQRRVSASSYYVSKTYAGLLEGAPTEEWSERELQKLPDRLRGIFGNWPVHIVPPTLVVSAVASEWHGYEIHLLPPVCVAADFRSFSPVKDDSMHASCLIIAWYQHHDFPILSEENRSRLADTDWEAMAVDFEY